MAIPTKYDGIEYRSRLEARWAAFMRNIGWDIVYEPFDGDGYIPDFLVQGDLPLLIEVKPAVTQADYEAPAGKAERGLTRHWQHDILIVGAAPISRAVGSLLKAGWYGEHFWAGTEQREHGAADWRNRAPEGDATVSDIRGGQWLWSSADWLWCIDCRLTTVRSSEYDWTARPCGHEQKRTLFAHESTLLKHWANACNDVKWRGTAA